MYYRYYVRLVEDRMATLAVIKNLSVTEMVSTPHHEYYNDQCDHPYCAHLFNFFGKYCKLEKLQKGIEEIKYNKNNS